MTPENLSLASPYFITTFPSADFASILTTHRTTWKPYKLFQITQSSKSPSPELSLDPPNTSTF